MPDASKSAFASRMKATAALRNGFSTAIVNESPRHVTSQRLRDHFELDGEVAEVDFVSSSKDSAVITFTNPKAFADVLLEGDRSIDGSGVTI